MLGYAQAKFPGPGQHYEFLRGAAQSPLQAKRPAVGPGQGQGQRGTGTQPIPGQSVVQGSVKYGHPTVGDLPLQARPSAPDPSMHPQFSHFAAVNEPPTTPGSYQTGPDALSHGSDKKGKKRGRPSKAENEIRAAQALARGEPWPPIKKAKNPRTSTEGATGPGDGAAASVLTKKVVRKPKTKPESGSAFRAGQAPAAQMVSTISTDQELPPRDEAHESDEMQIDPAKDQLRSTIPETQASEFPAADSLLAGMHAQAEQSALLAAKSGDATNVPKTEPTPSETVQSSITLQQEATPQTEQPRSAMSQA